MDRNKFSMGSYFISSTSPKKLLGRAKKDLSQARATYDKASRRLSGTNWDRATAGTILGSATGAKSRAQRKRDFDRAVTSLSISSAKMDSAKDFMKHGKLMKSPGGRSYWGNSRLLRK